MPSRAAQGRREAHSCASPNKEAEDVGVPLVRRFRPCEAVGITVHGAMAIAQYLDSLMMC